MKKILLSVALVMGAFVFANAQTTDQKPTNDTTETKSESFMLVQLMDEYSTTDTIIDTTKASAELAMLTENPEEGYKEITINEVTPKVKEKLSTDFESFTVKKVSYNSEKRLTKVVLVANADQTERTIIINEEGQIHEEKK